MISNQTKLNSLMKTNLKIYLLLLALLSLPGVAHAQGTAISYQGRLNDGSAPATGLYDFTFSVYDADVGPTEVLIAGPLALDAVPVTNGLFNVALDFGPDIFTSPARWLQISVRANGVGDLTLLTPRTPLLPTPYSIFAASAADVVNGSVVKSLNTLKDDVTLAAGENVTITPDGNTLRIASAGAGGSGIWPVLSNNAYYNAGNVGIGTATPARKLTVHTQGYGFEHTDGTIRLGTYLDPTGGWLGTVSDHPLKFFVNDGVQPSMTITANDVLMTPIGSLGLVNFGTPNGENGMTIRRGNTRADVRFNGVALKLVAGLGSGPPGSEYGIAITTAGNVGIGTETPGAKLHAETSQTYTAAVYGNATGLGGVGVFGSGPASGYSGYFTGKVRVGVLEIAGGSDLAEPFPMKEQHIEKGSVVVIDDEHPGRLKRSTEAYDKRVAGIVSGANGVNPGIALHQEGVLEGGENVALSGRVYVQADATFGAIKPGDLLTTSDTPGHAMKVTVHANAQGAILGKAMSGLKEGKGLVLVLVTLQ